MIYLQVQCALCGTILQYPPGTLGSTLVIMFDLCPLRQANGTVRTPRISQYTIHTVISNLKFGKETEAIKIKGAQYTIGEIAESVILRELDIITVTTTCNLKPGSTRAFFFFFCIRHRLIYLRQRSGHTQYVVRPPFRMYKKKKKDDDYERSVVLVRVRHRCERKCEAG